MTPLRVACRPLFYYRLVVKADGKVADYWVKAPTQCSATKHTALRPEVTEILYVTEVQTLPKLASVTFETDKDCP